MGFRDNHKQNDFSPTKNLTFLPANLIRCTIKKHDCAEEKTRAKRICARNPLSTAITRTAKDLNIYFSLASKCETNVSRNMIFVLAQMRYNYLYLCNFLFFVFTNLPTKIYAEIFTVHTRL